MMKQLEGHGRPKAKVNHAIAPLAALVLGLSLALVSCDPSAQSSPTVTTETGTSPGTNPGTDTGANAGTNEDDKAFRENASLSQAVRDYYRKAYGLSGAALKAKLHEILATTQSAGAYANLWTMYKSTDATPSGKVWDMYSSTSQDGSAAAYWFDFDANRDKGSGGGSEGQFYNREHSWPQSTFNGSSSGDAAYTDGHHIVPTDKYVNNQRGDLPYGEVGTATKTFRNGSKLGPAEGGLGYSGTVFEIADIYKGDIARMHFYMALRYYGDANFEACAWAGAGAKLLPWYDAMLKEWSAADPVSAKETARNEAVEAYQGDRNPFIDYPELVGLLDLEN
jgi:endonuclease I